MKLFGILKLFSAIPKSHYSSNRFNFLLIITDFQKVSIQSFLVSKRKIHNKKMGSCLPSVLENLKTSQSDHTFSFDKCLSVIDTEFDYTTNIATQKLLPIGSAFYTNSGILTHSGITAIIHAASGSMCRDGLGFTPTLKSVINSVKNSLLLSHINQHKKVAIPFIGGAIFLNRIRVDSDTLATAILTCVLDWKVEHREDSKIEVAMVAYSKEDTNLFRNVLNSLKVKNEAYALEIEEGRVQVVSGDITKFTLHHADVIVNAANTEAVFGGGLSGAIARATQNENQINKEAANIVNLYTEYYLNK